MLALNGPDDMFANQVRSILEHWLKALAAVFEEASFDAEAANERAEDLLLQIQGAIVLSRGLGKVSVFKRVLSRLAKTAL